MSKGIRIHVYLDDCLIRADTPQEAMRATQEMVSLVENPQPKEVRTEAHPGIQLRGYQYDLSRALVRPTQDRWSKL